LIKLDNEIFKRHQGPLEMTMVFISSHRVCRTSECKQFRNLSFPTAVDFSWENFIRIDEISLFWIPKSR